MSYGDYLKNKALDGASGVSTDPAVRGLPGQDGKSIRYGTGAPTAGVGNNDDFYISTTTNMLYGPKANGAWPAGVSLIGPQGQKGSDGTAGTNGTNGTNGLNGTNGKDAYQDWLDQGNAGSRAVFLASLKGANGSNGTNGKDAYQDWLDQGNVGTRVAFLASLKGAAGTDGANGTNGSNGKDAYQDWLDAGNNGNRTVFLASLKGVDGAPGTAGTNGADGKTIRPGSGAPAAGLGVNGDFYIDTTAWFIYGPKAAGAWPAGVSIIGPAGTGGGGGSTYDPTLAETLSNKRIKARVSTVNAPGATPACNSDLLDRLTLTGVNANITSMTTNLTGTPVEGDGLTIDITDAGTSRTIAWGVKFEDSTITLPGATTSGKKMTVYLDWNPVTSKWRCVGVA